VKTAELRATGVAATGPIFRASLTLAAAAAVATGVSFGKELLVARQYGAGVQLDAYLVAFAVVTLLPTTLGFILQATFIPAFMAVAQESREKAFRFSSTVIILVSAILIVAIAAIVLTGQTWVGLVAPGFTISARTQALEVTHLLLPLVWLVGLNELLKAQLNCLKSFALPAASQILPSLFAIGGILALSGSLGVGGLAIGWVSGVVLQSILLMSLCLRRGLRLGGDVGGMLVAVRNLVRQSLPYSAVALMPWALLLIDQNLASRLGPGSISILGYADKIFRLPLTVLIAAIYTGLHPYLAEAAAARRYDDFQQLADRMLRVTLFLLLPVGLAIVLLRQPIVVMVYQRGAFTASATNATVGVLLYLGLQVPALGLWYVYDRALVSLRRTSYLMVFALLTIAVKFVMSLALIRTLGLAGLACATLVALSASVVFMHVALHRLLRAASSVMLGADVVKIVVAALGATLISTLTWSWLAGGPAWVALPLVHTALVMLLMASTYAVFTLALNHNRLRGGWRSLL
jgi:putative peptidoglycan lipid II flippase